MISFVELLSGNSLSDVPLAHQQNLQALLPKLNVIRSAWGKPMTVTSGYRTLQHHMDIYRAKGVPDAQVPMNSRHLFGEAADIFDEDGALNLWLTTDPTGITTLEKAGLWCENRQGPWQHFQSVPPASGHRFFNP